MVKKRNLEYGEFIFPEEWRKKKINYKFISDSK